jgi:outer membrane protein
LAFCLGIGMAAASAGAWCAPQSFSALLARARAGEPGYLAARAGEEAANARVGEAYGAMLPQVEATGGTNAKHRKYKTRSPYVPEEKDHYNSHSSQISLTLPLFHYENIAAWHEAKSMAAEAHAQLDGAGQSLFVKLASAWFDFLGARDALDFARQQAETQEIAWHETEEGEVLSENSRLEAEEAKAKFDQAVSDRETARAELQLKRSAVEQLSGPLGLVDPPFIREGASFGTGKEESLAFWLAEARRGNPALLAATRAFEAANAEMAKQRAGHLPSLDLVASYGKNSQQVGGFPGQDGYDITEASVGLQLRIPIYSGGAQSAKVQEAVALGEKARQEMEAARRGAAQEVQEAWFVRQSAKARGQAGRQAVRHARLAVSAAELSEEEGQDTGRKVAEARQQLMAALRDLRRAQYDEALSQIRLKAAAGALTRADALALDWLFTGQPGTETEKAMKAAAAGAGEK